MPFLRAALLKKKAIQEQEEEILIPPVPVVAEEEAEPEKLPNIDNLLKVIDEKAKLEEEAELKEHEAAELDKGHSDDIAEPEMVSGNTKDIHVPEVDDDIYFVSEVQEQKEEQQEEPKIESEPKPESKSKLESEPEQEPESGTATQTQQKQEQEHEEQPESEAAESREQEYETESKTDTETETRSELKSESETESDSVSDTQPKSKKDYSGATLDYDFTSGKRYVDSVSTKTDFDRMLDELSAISGDLLSHEVEKFAKKFTGKFQGDLDKAESDAKKYEAFLGGYITNAAMLLYDNGYREAAIKRLEQAKSILEARKKLEDETAAIKSRVEEENDSVDLSDLLGLFGD